MCSSAVERGVANAEVAGAKPSTCSNFVLFDVNTKSKGTITEGAVISALLKAGKKILMPIGENSRYDLVFEDETGFKRVQCKTGRYRGGAVRFNSCSTGNVRKAVRKDYRGQVDFFGVYSPDTDKVYLVPVDLATVSETTLRTEAPANTPNSAFGAIRWAKDFELGRHVP